jgi:hypothetical protein
MIDRIVCRECGALLKSSNSGMAKKHTGHLWRRHRMTLKEYKLAHPGAPLYTLQLNAVRSRSNVKDLISKRVNAFLTPEELAACRKSPSWERDRGLDVVVCRVCGRKLKANLCGGDYHLSQHGLNLKEYRAKYPNAPWRTAATTARHRQGMIKTRARRTAKLAKADRILAQRTPEEMLNAARLTAAAGLQIRVVKKYQRSGFLFPEQNIKKCAVTSTKQYYRRRKEQIDAEEMRLRSLSEADREADIEVALSYLAGQARPAQAA